MDWGPKTALLLAELGFLAEQRGDAETALTRHLDGFAAARTTGNPAPIALALEGIAGANALAGDATHAARLLGAAAALRRSTGTPVAPTERADLDRVTAPPGPPSAPTASTRNSATGPGSPRTRPSAPKAATEPPGSPLPEIAGHAQARRRSGVGSASNASGSSSGVPADPSDRRCVPCRAPCRPGFSASRAASCPTACVDRAFRGPNAAPSRARRAAGPTGGG